MTQTIKPRLTPSNGGKTWSLSTNDSFENFAARVGLNTANQGAAATYGFNPVTRNRLRLEWCYRGSWMAGIVVDSVAEDMTREWIELKGDDKPDRKHEFMEYTQELQIQAALSQVIKNARLYGGGLGFLLIDGQDATTPLVIDSITKDQFKGIYPLDRWMCNANLQNLVTEFGPDLGKPAEYELLPDTGTGLKHQNIHHTRLIRMDGVWLPYWQKITENYWGQSVLERLWDRMTSFDSATLGAAQLTYKAHLRTYSVENLRDIIAAGGDILNALLEQIKLMRLFQSNEGLTLMDSRDSFEAHQYTFAGLSDIIMQFGMQLSGAAQIPLVRLFGQSPAGLSATGESDMRNYYDGIKMKQTQELRPGMWKLLQIMYRSKFGSAPSQSFGFHFRPLWQLTDEQKAGITQVRTTAIVAAAEANLVDRATGMRELKTVGETTGTFTHIEDEAIEAAENDPIPTPEALGLALPPKPVPGNNGGSGNAAGPKKGTNDHSRAGLRAVT
jgi:phage-related protein (TIGR01555 family)